MPVSVLIPPDNRLLGWPLSDMTLYGTQPTPGMSIGPSSDGDAALAAAPSPAGAPAGAPAAAQAAPPESERAADETSALIDREGPSPVPSSASPAILVDHPAAADPQPSVPQPIGSGSFLQAPVATPLQTASADHGGGVASDGLSHITDGALAGHALDAIGTVDTLVADVGAAELLPAGADIAGLVGAALDATPLSAFGGSDPAAGLQTLIGMVDSADAFDLGHATTSVDTAPASILDALAADEAPSSLLGDESDGGHHLLDDHDIHLGI